MDRVYRQTVNVPVIFHKDTLCGLNLELALGMSTGKVAKCQAIVKVLGNMRAGGLPDYAPLPASMSDETRDFLTRDPAPNLSGPGVLDSVQPRQCRCMSSSRQSY